MTYADPNRLRMVSPGVPLVVTGDPTDLFDMLVPTMAHGRVMWIENSDVYGLTGTDTVMVHTGKKIAGRTLDGRTHDGFPTLPSERPF